MSIRHWVSTSLLALALCTLGLRSARAQGQAAEGKPNGSQAGHTGNGARQKADNANPGKTDSLRDLEDQLFRSFKAPPPKGPLNGPGPEPPRTPSTQSKRAKELQDRKDWVLNQPDELMAVPTVEELLNLAPLDKKENSKEKLTPLENYLDRLYHPDDPNRNNKPRYGELDPFGSLKKKDGNRDKEQDPGSFY